MNSETRIDNHIRLLRESGIDWIELMDDLIFYSNQLRDHTWSGTSDIESKDWRLRTMILLDKLYSFHEFIEEYDCIMESLEKENENF